MDVHHDQGNGSCHVPNEGKTPSAASVARGTTGDKRHEQMLALIKNATGKDHGAVNEYTYTHGDW